MKPTASTGFDAINAKILKQIPEITSMWITHLTNSIFRTSRFPKILKISKITPISKPNKVKVLKNSYRPISNLNTIEKVV